MSKQSTILRFVVPIILLIVILLLGFYLYQRNLNRPLTKEEIEANQRKELMSYTIDPNKQKSEMEQRKDLEMFNNINSKSNISEDEMREMLSTE